jgi:hypothetical protein
VFLGEQFDAVIDRRDRPAQLMAQPSSQQLQDAQVDKPARQLGIELPLRRK